MYGLIHTHKWVQVKTEEILIRWVDCIIVNIQKSLWKMVPLEEANVKGTDDFSVLIFTNACESTIISKIQLKMY